MHRVRSVLIPTSFIIITAFVLLFFQVAHSSSGRKWKKPSSDAPIFQGSAPQDILTRGTLRVGLTPGYLPFEVPTPTGELIGFDVELATEITNAMNVKLELVSLEWEDLIQSLISNRIDIILTGMEITEERKQTISFVPYFIMGESVLIRSKDSAKIKTYNDLNNERYSVAFVKGYYYSEQLAKTKLPNAKLVPYSDIHECANAMGSQLVDALIANYASNSIVMLKLAPEPHTILPDLLTENTLGIGYRKNDSELGIWLTTYITKIKQDGTFNKIEYKWFKDPTWFQSFFYTLTQ
ncbi:transporter substrate-binding domain-containing protein [Desulfopila sp. IMCC35008]|uniref:transporter substrate-binding domain-containing protein n=1 Tax=Desulfopila sp. IMCC35008 TaxID=2653858 RepID=UPI0013CF44E9|nr:transporter substrate-binding domain-containing protein [Desulfopila sp. IMCC35008]